MEAPLVAWVIIIPGFEQEVTPLPQVPREVDIIATGFHIWGTYHELPHLGQLAYTPMYVSSINMTYLCCTSFYWTSLCSASLSCTF